LESCPACEYAVVIENQNEKLFNCQRDDCGLVSCRACRYPVREVALSPDSDLSHRVPRCLPGSHPEEL
jgi:hypothetical protein